MPVCQLNRLVLRLEALEATDLSCGTGLRSMVSTIGSLSDILNSEHRMTFWLDTMCIPVAGAWRNGQLIGVDERYSSLKKAAIARMTPIYAGAWRVLVLDYDLQRTLHSATPPEEILARVLRSTWMWRCWTLHEASLAQNLIIQFADGHIWLAVLTWRLARAFETNYKRSRGLKDHGMFIQNIKAATMHTPVGAVENTFWKDHGIDIRHRDLQLVKVWNQMVGRSTSNWEDAHGILANLLDFNAGTILKLPIRERMKALLCAQERLPLWFLFINIPRLVSEDEQLPSETELYRWVPPYVGGPKVSMWKLPRGYATIVSGEDAGLHVGSHAHVVGFLLSGEAHRHPVFYFLDTINHKRYWVQLHSQKYRDNTAESNYQAFLNLGSSCAL